MLEVQLNSTIAMRLIERRDAAALFELVDSGRADFERWIPFVSKTRSQEDAFNYIMRFLDMYKEGKGYVYGLWDGKKMIGNVMIKDIDDLAKTAEIGSLTDYQIAQVDIAYATGTLLGASHVQWAPTRVAGSD